jgi:hypothetical protein
MRNPSLKDRAKMPYVPELIKHIRGRIYESIYLACQIQVQFQRNTMSRRPPLLVAAILAASAPAFAAPAVNTAVFATDVRVPSSGSTGLQTLWNLSVSSVDACTGLTATFSQGSQTFALLLNADPVFTPCNFSQNSFPFAGQAGLLAFAGSASPWSYTVTDSTGSITGLFPINAAPEVLPFAQNVLASDASRTPTVSWTLPDLTGFDVDRVRLRVLDEDLAGTIVYQADLASDATSYVVPNGVLEINHRYTYVVLLDDLDNGLLENRSRRRSLEPIAVIPEPGTWALMAAGLAAIVVRLKRRNV